MGRKCLLVGLLVVVVLAGGCAEEGDKGLKTTGTVEIEELRVIAEVGGTIEEITVKEGESVKQGQALARLSTSELQAKKEQAEAGLKAAQAKLAELQKGNRAQDIAAGHQELERVKAEVESARADCRLQQDTLEKYRRLANQGAITEQELKVQENLALNAQYRLEGAEATLRAAESRLDLLIEGARAESIQQLEAQVQSAKAAVKLSVDNLSKAVLYAPEDGTVMTCNFNEGEVVQPGAEVITLGETGNLYLYTYVPEEHLNEVQLGKETDIVVDSYPDRVFKGTVSYISPEAEFTPKNVQTKEDRVRLVFKVKIDVTKGQENLLPGMPADIYFNQPVER